MDTKNINKGKISIKEAEWFDAQFGLILYASDEVYRKALNATRSTENTPTEMLFELGALIKLMRKEVGLSSEEEITIRECLSIFITDINDSKYDKEYEKYIKNRT